MSFAKILLIGFMLMSPLFVIHAVALYEHPVTASSDDCAQPDARPGSRGK